MFKSQVLLMLNPFLQVLFIKKVYILYKKDVFDIFRFI